MKVNPRFTKAASIEVYTGVELLVKGCLETEGGVHLWTGYPGSPIAGFFDTAEQIQELLQAKGIRAALANNEALGVAMVNGSQMSGLRSICLQKSVGVHVAADALALGNLVGAHPEGGALIVLGDDPWSDSTQVPADSRYICKHLMMPVMEPGDMQEVKDWVDLGFKLSRESELYIGYLVTTNQMDGGGSTMTRQNQFPERGANSPFEIDTQAIDLERNVLLPPRTWKKEETIHERYERLWHSAREKRVTRILPARRPVGTSRSIGFITSGSAFVYLKHALAELGLSDAFPILKYGITYPIDPSWLEEFAQDKEQLFVIEERRGFVEEQIIEALNQLRQDGKVANELTIWGKRFPYGLEGIPSTRGLNPSLLIDRIGKLALKAPQMASDLKADRIHQELDVMAEANGFSFQLPKRTPTFCPGCPHRDSASVLMEVKKQFRNPKYMENNHGINPVDLLFHGDTGCYTMLMFEPTKDLMHNYSGMGLGGGTGAGIDPFIKNKQVVFMGDSTFFHSGQAAISNSLKNNQDITYIILDNKTTAMTGHQPTPGLETNLMGELTFAQNIERIVGAMTEQSQPGITVVRVNPEEREDYRKLLEKTILQDGVKVLVADKECGITFHRRINRQERQTIRQKGFIPEKKHINITHEVCENCLECTKATGCPGLSFEKTPLGRKVQIDTSWCVADGACTRFMVSTEERLTTVKACPSFEEVIVKRSQAPLSGLDRLNLDRLPTPEFSLDKEKWPQTWRGYLAGVGGMGIGTATAVLVMAAKKEGWRALFCDKKGLAIRNGGVYSMLTFTRPDAPYTSNVIPYGKADLILGVDLLEALRALDPKSFQRIGSQDRTSIIVNSHRTPTILQLLGQEEWNFEAIENQLKDWAQPGQYFSADVSQVSEALFGSKLYSNIMLMGCAYQMGKIPLRLESVEGAITEAMGPGAKDNLKAFHVGRALVADPQKVMVAAQIFHEPDTFEEVVQDKKAILGNIKRKGPQLAAAYEALIQPIKEDWKGPKETLRDLAYRIYDLIQFDSPAYAQTYINQVMEVHAADDRMGSSFEATRAVVWNLHKVMAIKDEVYVAHLLTSEEKRRRDYARYNIDTERGDRLIYKHLNRPEFNVFGMRLAWDMKTRDWMLNLMKRAKWLRRALPLWHKKEKDFRAWYSNLVSRFLSETDQSKTPYMTWVQVLDLPDEVTGYREIRYPKIAVAMEQAERLLNSTPTETPTRNDEVLEPATDVY